MHVSSTVSESKKIITEMSSEYSHHSLSIQYWPYTLPILSKKLLDGYFSYRSSHLSDCMLYIL